MMTALKHFSNMGLVKTPWYLSVLFMVLCLPFFALAQPLLQENFATVNGTLLTNAGWTQLAAGTPNVATVSGNLSYNYSIGTGIGNKVSLGNTGQDVYRTFTAPASPAYASLLVNVSAAQAAGNFFLGLGATTTVTASVYIRSNGAGFSFGLARGTGTPVYESNERTFGTTYFVALKYTTVSGTTNDVINLFVNPVITLVDPDPNVAPFIPEPGSPTITYNATGAGTGTDGAISAIQLIQGDAASSATLDVDAITVGALWETITQAQYDFGDVPTSYEANKDGVLIPAQHNPLTTLKLGFATDAELTAKSVIAGTDNNTTNGDGSDEDGLVTLAVVYKDGTGLTFPITVTAPAGTKYMYAWLDLNGNGKFELGELTTTVTSFTPLGTFTRNLTWNAAQLATIPNGTTKIYLRIRLSSLLLADFTTAANGGAVLDERSIGNGATSAASALNDLVTPNGEVEDYQLDVQPGTDYGDLPVSYENDNSNIFRPAVHINTPGLSLGTNFDGEAVATSVAANADNNGANGDGDDEDGIDISLADTVMRNGSTYAIPISITATGSSNKNLYAWLDLDGNGKFSENELTTASISDFTTTGTFTRTLTWSAAQLATIPVGTSKVYLRVRLSQTTALIDATGTTAVDERSIGNGAVSTSNAANSISEKSGEVEDYQLAVGVGTDYGDLPVSFEQDKDGNSRPAVQSRLAGFSLGSIVDGESVPASVAIAANNNAPFGDDAVNTADEDGITVLPSVFKNSAGFTLPINVINTSGTRFLYGWLDFNGDGKFQVGEAASLTFLTAGTSVQSLGWSKAQIATLDAAATKIYLRIRLSAASLIDFTGASGGATIDERSVGNGAASVASAFNATSMAVGEVEDYQLDVVPGLDYGDLPITFDNDKDGNARPAVHAKQEGVTLGVLFDGEVSPASVAVNGDNNALLGDGDDEDGIAELPLIFKNTIFSTSVNVTNTTGTKRLYGWLDLNADGKFQVGELSTSSPVAIAASPLGTVQTLSWPQSTINTIAIGTSKIYLRLRLSSALLVDFTTAGTGGANIDERSVGNGATSASNAANAPTIAEGEVEDYQLGFSDGLDYGDVPVSYDKNNTGAFLPARNAPSQAIRIGGIPDAELTAQSVPAGLSNNNADGDGGDENGLTTLTNVTIGSDFSLSVRVTNTTGSAAILRGWLDLNGDGIFQVTERASTLPSVANGTNNGLATITWSAAQTANMVGADKIYLRLRFSTNTNASSWGSTTLSPDRVAIGDGNNTETYGNEVFSGEVEDYKLGVTPSYDYGDLPLSFEFNSSNVAFPARHLTTTNGTTALYLGHSSDVVTDAEGGSKYVSNGSDNNGSNGDGADENGLDNTQLAVQAIIGSPYSITVKVNRGSAAGATRLFGWLDFNNDGKFQAREENTNTSTITGTGNQNITLTWNSVSAAGAKMYLRLRLTSAVFFDLNSTAIDEKSIGNGTSGGNYAGAIPNGEIEDYYIPTNFVTVPSNIDCSLYNRIQSGFHQTIALGPDGIYKIWGEGVGSGSNYGSNDILDPIRIDKYLFPNLTGTVLKATLSSNFIGITTQVVVLSSDGLFASGVEGRILPNGLTINSTFQKIISPLNAIPATGLPVGVAPEDVANMHGTPGSLLLLTKPSAGGKIYVLGASVLLHGDRTSNSSVNSLWHIVTSYDGTELSGIVHLSASSTTGFAVDASENFYTWGSQQYLGDGTSLNAASGILPTVAASFYRARPMEKPAGWTATRMIATTAANSGSYFAVGTDGNLFSMGDNQSACLGVGNSATSTVWQQVKTDANTNLTNVYMISANDQDVIGYKTVGATTNDGELFTWGSINGRMSGQQSPSLYAAHPVDFVTGTDKANYVEVGGHTTVYVKDGSSKYCYVGHKIRGSMGDGTSEDAFQNVFTCTSTGDAQIACSQQLDGGDAPTAFENGLGDNRAVHSFFYSTNVYLGVTPPNDDYATLKNVSDKATNEGADGDGPEEDGVIKSAYNAATGSYSVTVSAFNNSGKPATVYGWIDWNADGTFIPEEFAQATVPTSASQQTGIVLTWTKPGTIICNTIATTVRSYIRVRFTTDAMIDIESTNVDERSLGAASDGEIEDYFLDWDNSELRDFGNIANTATVFWPLAYATLPATGNKVWLGSNADQPSAECETDNNDANTSGFTITGSGVIGSGTVATPFVLAPGSSYNFNVTVNGSGTAGTNVYWGAWFDIDGNGRFDDATDIFQAGTTAHGSPVTASVAVSVPSGSALTSDAKVRVIVTAVNTLFTKAQNGEVKVVNGEVEDYYVNLQNNAGITLRVNVLLEGATIGNIAPFISTMRDNLRNSPFTAANYIPTTDPYTFNADYNTKFIRVGDGTNPDFQTINTPATMFADRGTTSAVDWIFIELRSKSNPATVLGTRSAIVQRDGSVVDVNGSSCVRFPSLVSDDYYVAVRHRNHLGVMTATAVSTDDLNCSVGVDFSTRTPAQLWNSTVAYDGYEMKLLADGKRALWAGDADASRKIKYTAPGDDLFRIFNNALNHPGNTSSDYNYDFGYGYIPGDVDMNSKVKYTAPGDDAFRVFVQLLGYGLNTGSDYNYDFFLEQLP